MEHLSDMCISPGTAKQKKPNSRGGYHLPFPCGKCYQCLQRKASQWIFRIEQESKLGWAAQFITLTYADEHLPTVKCYDNEGTEYTHMNLVKSHVQQFFKDLRKLNPIGIKYYAVGEYGGKTHRPHYHIILLNAGLETIKHAWQYGQIYYGSVLPNSIAYTVAYMEKPCITKSGKFSYKIDNRQPRFALMSKKLGINYITPQIIQWHRADLLNRCYITMSNGVKVAMPRYYKEKIYTKSQLLKINNYIKKMQLEKEHDLELLEGRYSTLKDQRIQNKLHQNSLINRTKNFDR